MFKIFAIVTADGVDAIVYSEAAAAKARKELKKEFDMASKIFIVEHAQAGEAEESFNVWNDDNRADIDTRINKSMRAFFEARGCTISKK